MPYRKRFQSPKDDCLCYNLLSPYKEEVLKTEELVSLRHVLIYQDLDLLDHLLCQTQVTEFSGEEPGQTPRLKAYGCPGSTAVLTNPAPFV